MSSACLAPLARDATSRVDLGALFALIVLGAAFLSGIASRFGWWGDGVGFGSWANFEREAGPGDVLQENPD